MVVREVIPRLPVRAVVLTDRAPLALAHIRSPQVPVASLSQSILEPPESGYSVTLNTHRHSRLSRRSLALAGPLARRRRRLPGLRHHMIYRGPLRDRVVTEKVRP